MFNDSKHERKATFKASIWMGRNSLKRLAIVMKDYDPEITNAIKDYFSDGTNHGDYLMNILWDYQIRYLQRLNEKVDINAAMKAVIRRKGDLE